METSQQVEVPPQGSSEALNVERNVITLVGERDAAPPGIRGISFTVNVSHTTSS